MNQPAPSAKIIPADVKCGHLIQTFTFLQKRGGLFSVEPVQQKGAGDENNIGFVNQLPIDIINRKCTVGADTMQKGAFPVASGKCG